MVIGNTHIFTIRKISQQHNDEKQELQQLNKDFDLFIRRLKSLEDENHRLHFQADSVKQNWGNFLGKKNYMKKKKPSKRRVSYS